MLKDRVPASAISTLALVHASRALPECSATDASSRVFTASRFASHAIAIRPARTHDPTAANATRTDSVRARLT